MFVCFYLTRYTEQEKEDLFQGMLDGIILGFFLLQGLCFVFRPYDVVWFLFEALCVRDLRVFADALGGQVYHYRDKDGLECDAVIHLRNGAYGLVEVKLGGDKMIEEGAGSLKALSEKIDTDKMKKPSFRMVLTGTGDYAYRRSDDVYVVPIGCLKDWDFRL